MSCDVASFLPSGRIVWEEERGGGGSGRGE